MVGADTAVSFASQLTSAVTSQMKSMAAEIQKTGTNILKNASHGMRSDSRDPWSRPGKVYERAKTTFRNMEYAEGAEGARQHAAALKELTQATRTYQAEVVRRVPIIGRAWSAYYKNLKEGIRWQDAIKDSFADAAASAGRFLDKLFSLKTAFELLKGAWNIAQSLLMTGIGLITRGIQGAINLFKQGWEIAKNYLNELYAASAEYAKKFGVSGTVTAHVRAQVQSLYLGYEDLIDSMGEAVHVTMAWTEAWRSTDLRPAREMVKLIFEAGRVTGLDVAEMAQFFRWQELAFGRKSVEQQKTYLKGWMGFGKQFNIPMNMIVKSMNEQRRLFALLGTAGEASFKKLLILSQKTNINMGEIVQAMEKFDSIEDTIPAIAKMNILMGSSIDAFQVFAQAESPADRLLAMIEPLKKAGHTWASIPYFYKKGIAEATNMSVENLQVIMESTSGVRAATLEYQKQADVRKASDKEWQSFMYATKSFFVDLSRTLRPLYATIARMFAPLGPMFTQAMRKVNRALAGMFNEHAGFGRLVRRIGEWISSFADKFVTMISDSRSGEAMDSLLNTVEKLWGVFAKLTSKGADWLVKEFPGALRYAAHMAEKLYRWFDSDKVLLFKDGLTSVTDWFDDHWPSILDGLTKAGRIVKGIYDNWMLLLGAIAGTKLLVPMVIAGLRARSANIALAGARGGLSAAASDIPTAMGIRHGTLAELASPQVAAISKKPGLLGRLGGFYGGAGKTGLARAGTIGLRVGGSALAAGIEGYRGYGEMRAAGASRFEAGVAGAGRGVGVLAGAAVGAKLGALVGTIAGPVGTAVGGLVGGIAGAIGTSVLGRKVQDLYLSTKDHIKTLAKLTNATQSASIKMSSASKVLSDARENISTMEERAFEASSALEDLRLSLDKQTGTYKLSVLQLAQYSDVISRLGVLSEGEMANLRSGVGLTADQFARLAPALQNYADTQSTIATLLQAKEKELGIERGMRAAKAEYALDTRTAIRTTLEQMGVKELAGKEHIIGRLSRIAISEEPAQRKAEAMSQVLEEAGVKNAGEIVKQMNEKGARIFEQAAVKYNTTADKLLTAADKFAVVANILEPLAQKKVLTPEQLQYVKATSSVDEALKRFATTAGVEIPGMADGGYVVSKGGQLIATVAERGPELVVPEGKFKQIISGVVARTAEAGAAATEVSMDSVVRELRELREQFAKVSAAIEGNTKVAVSRPSKVEIQLDGAKVAEVVNYHNTIASGGAG